MRAICEERGGGLVGETYSSNIWRIRMLQQTMHLFDSKLHREEFIEKTKCCGRTSTVAGHPWLHMIDLIVNLINNFVVSLQSVKLFKIIRREDVHAKHLLKQSINRSPRGLYLHNVNAPYKQRHTTVRTSANYQLFPSLLV